MSIQLPDLLFVAGVVCALTGAWLHGLDTGLMGTGVVLSMASVIWRRIEIASKRRNRH